MVGALLVVVAEAGLGDLRAHLLAVLPRQRERVRDPAVRGDDVAGNGAVIDAEDRFACDRRRIERERERELGRPVVWSANRKHTLTDQIVGRYDDAAHEQDSTGQAVVEAEHHVVDDRLLDQVAHLHEAGDGRHQTEQRHCGAVMRIWIFLMGLR